MKSFGTNFILISDTIQKVPALAIGYPPQAVIHHATVKRGFNEYVVLSAQDTNEVYVNRVVRNKVGFELEKVKDDIEYEELLLFLRASGVLSMGGVKKHAD